MNVRKIDDYTINHNHVAGTPKIDILWRKNTTSNTLCIVTNATNNNQYGLIKLKTVFNWQFNQPLVNA